MSQTKAIEDIVRITNRRAIKVDEVLRKANLTLRQFQTAVEDASKRGYQIALHDGYVFSQNAVRAQASLTLGSTKPGRYVVGHWSDTHFGCRHSDEEAMLEHLHRCHEAGAQIMVHTGDGLDGNKPVLLGDQDYVGFESQSTRMVRLVKKAPPMVYVAIDGNHDGYFSAAIGAPCGKLLEGLMQQAGVSWNFAGVCVGRAKIHGAHWQLWHPSGGSQGKLGVIKVLHDRAADAKEHIDVLAMGHLHKFVSANLEGTLLVAPGTFQRMGSEFANRISGPWDIGGALVSYDLDKRGEVHALASEFFPARAA